MHIAVQQGLQRAGSYDFSDILEEELDLQLNRSIEVFVKTRFDISEPDPLGFEQTQKRLDDIRTLIRTNTYNNVVDSLDSLGDEEATALLKVSKTYSAILPKDSYWFSLRLQATTRPNPNCKDSNGNYNGPELEVPVRILRNNQLTFHLNHPWSTTSAESPIAVLRDGNVVVYTDGVFEITSLEFEYIKAPVVVNFSENVNCDLPVHTHTEIVDLTVQHLSGVIQSSNYQQHVIERSQNE